MSNTSLSLDKQSRKSIHIILLTLTKSFILSELKARPREIINYDNIAERENIF